MRFARGATIGELYNPAMEIHDVAEAKAYFEDLVHRCMGQDRSREEAEVIERANLGYYAGYYPHETRIRVERLFACEHPVFGEAAAYVPTAKDAMRAGIRRAGGDLPGSGFCGEVHIGQT